jgi:hypothetical protein
LRFAAAAAFCSLVAGVRAFFGLSPKSASASGALPKAAFTYATYASIQMRSAGRVGSAKAVCGASAFT